MRYWSIINEIIIKVWIVDFDNSNTILKDELILAFEILIIYTSNEMFLMNENVLIDDVTRD